MVSFVWQRRRTYEYNSLWNAVQETQIWFSNFAEKS